MTIALLTADEFSRMPDPGHPQELCRGRVVNHPIETAIHGAVCGNIAVALEAHCRAYQLGCVTMRIGIVTGRGPDVVFLSRFRFDSANLPDEYLSSPPDCVFDVLDRSDRWRDVHGRISDYLGMGVDSVYVVDPRSSRVHCYYPDRPDEILTATDEFVGVGPLAAFRVPVAKFFE